MPDPRKVLVIDDEVHIRRVIEVILKKRGYEVITAKNGEEGLAAIRSLHPDAVISDIRMPKLDGEALCKMVNPLKEFRSFLTVIMTARISPDEQKWIDGMKDTIFMEKPFSPLRLADCIDRYFEDKLMNT
ncbi:MAG: response regulator [Syntrophales bacterium]|nr:response regulator [Syntrophales bacterium]